MMDLESAIQHCEEVAEENEEIYEAHCRIYSKEVVEKYPSPPCKKCADEHRQLAAWLKELKAYRNKSEIPTSCGDAISRQSAIFLASDLKQDLPDDERIADMVMAHNEGILEYQTQLSLLPSVSP